MERLSAGGTVPLAATLATADVFDAFRGAAKTDALLHGHSYSGHAIGLCAAAAALEMLADPAANPALCAPPHACRRARPRGGAGAPGAAGPPAPAAAVGAGRDAMPGSGGAAGEAGVAGAAAGEGGSGCCAEPCGRLVEMWDPAATAALSMRPDVARVVAIGDALMPMLAWDACGRPLHGSGERAHFHLPHVPACVARHGHLHLHALLQAEGPHGVCRVLEEGTEVNGGQRGAQARCWRWSWRRGPAGSAAMAPRARSVWRAGCARPACLRARSATWRT